MTAQPINPFVPAGGVPRAGRITVADLHGYADELNRQRFVVDSGVPYFVNRRVEDDGTVKHYLDRKSMKGASQ